MPAPQARKTPIPTNSQPTISIRLNRLLARHGLCSRRKADEWIRDGRVSVDGIVCREVGTTVNPDSQRIAVDGTILESPPDYYYIALNKPTGVITTMNDPQKRKTVMELLPQKFQTAGLAPVGRLDYQSEGLLILTNDGDWNMMASHPSSHRWKKYWVKTGRPLERRELAKLESGVIIEGKQTMPARVKPVSGQSAFWIEIQEGRNRQIRRMCERFNVEILRLKRVSIGKIELKDLAPGQWRELTETEIESIKPSYAGQTNFGGRS